MPRDVTKEYPDRMARNEASLREAAREFEETVDPPLFKALSKIGAEAGPDALLDTTLQVQCEKKRTDPEKHPVMYSTKDPFDNIPVGHSRQIGKSQSQAALVEYNRRMKQAEALGFRGDLSEDEEPKEPKVAKLLFWLFVRFKWWNNSYTCTVITQGYRWNKVVGRLFIRETLVQYLIRVVQVRKLTGRWMKL